LNRFVRERQLCRPQKQQKLPVLRVPRIVPPRGKFRRRFWSSLHRLHLADQTFKAVLDADAFHSEFAHRRANCRANNRI
jgi:hypothetical protein